MLSRSTACMFALAPLAIPVGVAAQQPEGAKSRIIEEVVVTATRRETSLASTPLAISALNSEMLERKNVTDMSSLAAAVPGLNIVDQGPGLTRPVIRGLQGVGDAQVGIYLDNTPIVGSPGTANSAGRFSPEIKPVDVERVEILRGPQGTLYGGGSMGGAIRYITKGPEYTQVGGYLASGIKNYESSSGYTVDGALNIPLIEDKFAVRVVGYYQDDDGYIDNVVTGDTDINSLEVKGGRVSMGWRPTEALEILAKYYYEEKESAARAIVQTDLQDYATKNPALDPIQDETDIFNLSVMYFSGWLDITYSYSKYARDLVYRYSGVRDPFGRAPENFGGTAFIQPQDVDTETHEVRFVSHWDSAWQLTAGGFYNQRETFGESQLHYLDNEGNLIGIDGLPIIESDPASLLLLRNFDQKQTEQAIYGEISYTWNDKTTVTAGARVFEFDNDDAGQSLILFGAPFPGTPPRNQTDTNSSDTVYKLHFSRDVLEDAVIYAQWSQGYRAGGTNIEAASAGIDILDTPTRYEPDIVNNYEIGFRGALMDNSLTVSGAVFYLDWKDMFVDLERRDLEGIGALEFRGNAGEAEIKGLELEVEAFLGEDFKVAAGVNFLDAQLGSDVKTIGDSTGARDGDDLPFVPDYTFNISSEYGWMINELRAFIWAGYRFTGEATGDFNPYLIDETGVTNIPNIMYTEFGGYGVLDLRVGLEGEAWDATFSADNVTGQTDCVYERRDIARPQPGSCFIEKPLTIGLRVNYNF